MTQDGPTLATVDEVVAHICAGLKHPPPVRCEVASLVGRVPTADVAAPVALPRFDHSAMDGVAVRASDTVGASSGSPVVLTLVDPAYAGHDGGPEVAPGHARPVATGAPLPPGADAVVRKEWLHIDGGRVSITAPATTGDEVRRAGEDVAVGDIVLRAGRAVRPTQMALLSALSVRDVEVAGWPRIVVQPTGDEVAAIGRVVGPACISDAVGPAITALIRDNGGHVSLWPPASDDPDALAEVLVDRCIPADLVITVGGVSVGDRDVLARVLSRVGEARAWEVALRPGRRLVTGVVHGAVVLGLPGNPAAALAAFDLIARPVLAAMGVDAVLPTAVAHTTEAIAAAPDRRTLVRGVVADIRGQLMVTPLPGGSGAVGAFSEATVWLDLPAGCDADAGDIVVIRPLSRDVPWGVAR